jgi:acyl-CoA thioester hydrolase
MGGSPIVFWGEITLYLENTLMKQPPLKAGDFRFFHALEVRYGDIDAQRHLNNARYFTYMEQARIGYLLELGLWNGGDFEGVGMILAEQKCSYLKPILFGQAIEVGVRISRLGNKSFTMEYLFVEAGAQEPLAHGYSIQVAFDYTRQSSIVVPEAWRQLIEVYENQA